MKLNGHLFINKIFDELETKYEYLNSLNLIYLKKFEK